MKIPTSVLLRVLAFIVGTSALPTNPTPSSKDAPNALEHALAQSINHAQHINMTIELPFARIRPAGLPVQKLEGSGLPSFEDALSDEKRFFAVTEAGARTPEDMCRILEQIESVEGRPAEKVHRIHEHSRAESARRPPSKGTRPMNAIKCATHIKAPDHILPRSGTAPQESPSPAPKSGLALGHRDLSRLSQEAMLQEPCTA